MKYKIVASMLASLMTVTLVTGNIAMPASAATVVEDLEERGGRY